MANVLEAQNISVQFGGLLAVNNVTFNIPNKSIVSLIGPNGAGKTTFFNVLTGLYKPSAGSINYGGKDITAVKNRNIKSFQPKSKGPRSLTPTGIGSTPTIPFVPLDILKPKKFSPLKNTCGIISPKPRVTSAR